VLLFVVRIPSDAYPPRGAVFKGVGEDRAVVPLCRRSCSVRYLHHVRSARSHHFGIRLDRKTSSLTAVIR